MNSKKFYWVYATGPNKEEALRMAHILIKEKQAACVNVFPKGVSVYQWEGKIQEEDEIYFVLKTTAEKLTSLQARLVELHPYSCPCVVALPIQSGNPDFLDWVEKQLE